MLTPEEEAAQAAQAAVEIPKGRAAFIAAYKQRHPEVTEDPDDESLFDYAHRGLTERDEYEQNYTGLNKSNETLATAIAVIPPLAKWIAAISNGENPWKALGEILGPKAENLDDESLKQLHQGIEQYNKNRETQRANIANYNSALDNYVSTNELTPEDREEIHNTIMDMIAAFEDYDITEEIIDTVWKGKDYEANKAAELEAARLEARNAAIEEMKGTKREKSPVPDTGGAGNGNRKTKPAGYQPKIESLAEAFQERE